MDSDQSWSSIARQLLSRFHKNAHTRDIVLACGEDIFFRAEMITLSHGTLFTDEITEMQV